MKQTKKNWHITLEIYAVTAILLAFKLHHLKYYELSNKAALV